MLKIKLSQSGNDLNLNLRLKTQSQLSGLSEDIDNLVNDETNKSINDVTDQEKIRFSPVDNKTIKFQFWNGSSFVQTISPIDFTATEDLRSESFINSFYIIQVYTSSNEDKSTLIHTSYINGYQVTTSLSSSYSYSKQVEYGDIHIPVSYLNSLTGDSFYLYFKCSFYSAKSGQIHLFYNETTSLAKEEDLYYKISFGKTSYNYTIPLNMTFKEITNSDYINSVNDKVENIIKGRPSPPAGNTFTDNGEYITVD